MTAPYTSADWRDFYWDMEPIQLKALLAEWRETEDDANTARKLAKSAAERAARHIRAIEYEIAKRRKNGEKR